MRWPLLIHWSADWFHAFLTIITSGIAEIFQTFCWTWVIFWQEDDIVTILRANQDVLYLHVNLYNSLRPSKACAWLSETFRGKQWNAWYDLNLAQSTNQSHKQHFTDTKQSENNHTVVVFQLGRFQKILLCASVPMSPDLMDTLIIETRSITWSMKTSCHENAFHITGPLWGETSSAQ